MQWKVRYAFGWFRNSLAWNNLESSHIQIPRITLLILDTALYLPKGIIWFLWKILHLPVFIGYLSFSFYENNQNRWHKQSVNCYFQNLTVALVKKVVSFPWCLFRDERWTKWFEYGLHIKLNARWMGRIFVLSSELSKNYCCKYL